VEGESGYINLMKIKSRYYEDGVFPKLKEDIDKALEPFPQFREELFDKLYTFFSRYFSESGSIYFARTRYQDSIYERVYTDDRDVMLFWKTYMLYYVKTDRLFKNLEVEFEGKRFFFDVSKLEHKKANEKRELVYSFKERRKDGTLVFTVTYSEKGRITKTDEILRALRRQGVNLDEETLGQAFRLFERQSEVDYFICKNAKAFLEEQFDLWLYQYIFKGETQWTETRIQQLQVLKEIAYKIIAFIAQFEDELVRIWNKPKFVLNSNYVITLNRIAEKDTRLLERILEHPGMTHQVKEWRNLGMVGEDFRWEMVWQNDLMGKRLHERYQYLPLDTSYFKDLELDILGLFDNLDEALDGWLIKSENYQALNTILRKFRERVKCIYIDPPYNSESTEIDYINRYKHSSWMSLMENRLFLAKDFLPESGVISVAIDDNELLQLKHVISVYFPEEYGHVVVRSNPAGRSTPKGFSLNHEYVVFFSKSETVVVGRLQRTKEQIARYKETDEKGHFEWVNFRKHGGLKEESPKMFYPIYVNETSRSWRLPRMEWDFDKKEWLIFEEPGQDEQVLWPIDESGQPRRWKWAPERLVQNPYEVKVDKDRRGEVAIYIKSRMPKGITPNSWWDKPEYSATDYGTRTLKDLFGHHGSFTYPKAVELVADCIRVSSGDEEQTIILDFFAGSGTTAHAVINLNRQDGGRRKYILVEMADYFDTVLLPRIKKVVFSDDWKDGKAQNGQGISHFVKYYQLEQYEDVLRRAKYEDANLFENPYEDPYHQYIFLRDPKMLEALEVDLQNNKVKVDLSKLYDSIDIAETLSCLTGKWIKRLNSHSVEFEDGEDVDLKNLDWRLIKPLIWW
jgi:adenine-specific DNA-methyltransferase